MFKKGEFNMENKIVFVSYLNGEESIFKFSNLEDAKFKYDEIEVLNNYSYLELGVDNVVSPTEGEYDIVATSKISKVSNVAEARFEALYKEIASEIKENLKSISSNVSDRDLQKTSRRIINELLSDNLSEFFEDKISESLLKYKGLLVSDLFNANEKSLLNEVKLDVKYTRENIADLNQLVKLKDNKIIEVL